MQTLLCDGCAEYAQEISAADLSNLLWSKSSLKHCTDDLVVEASCMICPCFIRERGAFELRVQVSELAQQLTTAQLNALKIYNDRQDSS